MQTYNAVKIQFLIYLKLTQIDISGVTLKVFNMPMANYRKNTFFATGCYNHFTEQIGLVGFAYIQSHVDLLGEHTGLHNFTYLYAIFCRKS